MVNKAKREYIEAVAKATHFIHDKGQLVMVGPEWDFMEALATPSIATAVNGRTRGIQINGETYWIKPNPHKNFGMPGAFEPLDDKQDAYVYVLPNGQWYTHPTEFGALLMILKHATGGYDGDWAEWKAPE